MGKDLKGKEIGEGIVQQSNGLYVGRFVDRSEKPSGGKTVAFGSVLW